MENGVRVETVKPKGKTFPTECRIIRCKAEWSLKPRAGFEPAACSFPKLLLELYEAAALPAEPPRLGKFHGNWGLRIFLFKRLGSALFERLFKPVAGYCDGE